MEMKKGGKRNMGRMIVLRVLVDTIVARKHKRTWVNSKNARAHDTLSEANPQYTQKS